MITPKFIRNNNKLLIDNLRLLYSYIVIIIEIACMTSCDKFTAHRGRQTRVRPTECNDKNREKSDEQTRKE